MEIIWSKWALNRIEEIAQYIADDSPSRAKQFIDSLMASVDRLSDFPNSGSVVPENTAFRQVVFHEYRVIYRITAKGVEIVTVISPGLLAEKILKVGVDEKSSI